MLLFALYLMFLFCGKCDTHSCSALAIINSRMVSIVDSLLSTLHASANCILCCEANAYISFAMAATLSSGISQLRCLTLTCACTPLTKSEEIQIPLTCKSYFECFSVTVSTIDCCWFSPLLQEVFLWALRFSCLQQIAQYHVRILQGRKDICQHF